MVIIVSQHIWDDILFFLNEYHCQPTLYLSQSCLWGLRPSVIKSIVDNNMWISLSIINDPQFKYLQVTDHVSCLILCRLCISYKENSLLAMNSLNNAQIPPNNNS